MREHWGDSFEAARTARRLWLSASFLAGVPEEGLRNKDGKILLDRDRAKDAGILAAKDFAIGLMAPLEKSEDLWLAVFGARRMAEKSFADAVRGGATFGAFDPECADFAIGAWARSQSYFLKEVEIASRDWDDWEDLRSRPNGGLARRSAAPSPAEPSEREEDVLAEALRRAEPLEDADAMAQKFGFRCVRMGGRGSEISRKSAAALEEAFGALAKRAGIPEEAIGLGGLELSAGLDLGSCDAHCLPASKSLAFGAAGFVAHEWTHALEHFAESGEFPEIRSALRDLREEIGSLRQDEIPARELLGKLKAEAAGALWASESRLAHLAKSIGDERLVAWAIDPGSDARVAPRASEPLKAAWLEAISDGKDERGLRIPREREEAIAMARDIFEKGSGAEKPHPDLDILDGLVDFCRLPDLWAKEAGEMAAAGKSAFSIFAEIQDRKEAQIWKRTDGPYWSSEKELLARAAESFFHDLGVPALAYVEPEDYSSPQGQERERLEGKFDLLMSAAAKALKREKPELADMDGVGARLSQRRAEGQRGPRKGDLPL